MTDQDKERIERAALRPSFAVGSIQGFIEGAGYEHRIAFNRGKIEAKKELQPIIDALKKAMIKGTNLYANLLFDDDEITPYDKALRETKNSKIEGFNEGIEAALRVIEGRNLVDFKTPIDFKYFVIDELEKLKKPI